MIGAQHYAVQSTLQCDNEPDCNTYLHRCQAVKRRPAQSQALECIRLILPQSHFPGRLAAISYKSIRICTVAALHPGIRILAMGLRPTGRRGHCRAPQQSVRDRGPGSALLGPLTLLIQNRARIRHRRSWSSALWKRRQAPATTSLQV